MKKSLKTLLALLLSSLVISLTSCNLADKLIGPEGKWEQYDYSYTTNGTTITFNCYVMFSSTDVSVATDSNVNGTKKTLPAGLTVLVNPTSTIDSELATQIFGSGVTYNNGYLLKNFPLNSDAKFSDDDDENADTFKLTKTKWTLIYNGVRWSAEDRNTTAEGIFMNKQEFSLPNTSNLKWKNILANLIINNLLD